MSVFFVCFCLFVFEGRSFLFVLLLLLLFVLGFFLLLFSFFFSFVVVFVFNQILSRECRWSGIYIMKWDMVEYNEVGYD